MLSGVRHASHHAARPVFVLSLKDPDSGKSRANPDRRNHRRNIAMSYILKSTFGAAALVAALLTAPSHVQALPAGAKSLPLLPGVILARRECIAWATDENGVTRCVRY